MFNFSTENCKNCYKCVRSCPVKAIKFINNKAEIDEDKCIACGQCFVVCPKHARNVENEVEAVTNKLNSDTKVFACVDSSYIGAFDNPGKFVAGLKALGFYSVEEVAVGSEILTQKYIEYIQKNYESKYLISSTCPASYLYIRKYYPELTKYLIPVVTPMLALGKLIKKENRGNYTVYVGPCLSKKYETLPKDENSDINSIITFEEIMRMFRRNGINIDELEETVPDRAAEQHGLKYSISGDVWSELKDELKKYNYDIFYVNGLENTKSAYEALKNEEIDRAYMAVSVCDGSCINGPFTPKNASSICMRKQKIKKFSVHGWGTAHTHNDWSGIDFSCEHLPKEVTRKKATSQQITEILKMMDKTSRADELDCGACGYDTCRDKAQAVFEGMTHVEMCMPYMRGRAETISDVIFISSRNLIMVIDKNLNVKRINPSAETHFNVQACDIIDKPISNLMEDKDFKEFFSTKDETTVKKVKIPTYGLVVMQNIMYINKDDEIIVVMQNITEDEKRKEELDKLKKQTVLIAQNVIEKQMRVAQEIASLLGETTAETKVALNKLKDVVLKEGE